MVILFNFSSVSYYQQILLAFSFYLQLPTVLVISYTFCEIEYFRLIEPKIEDRLHSPEKV